MDLHSIMQALVVRVGHSVPCATVFVGPSSNLFYGYSIKSMRNTNLVLEPSLIILQGLNRYLSNKPIRDQFHFSDMQRSSLDSNSQTLDTR